MGYADCCTPSYRASFGGRRYWTKEERVSWLKDYADELEKELTAVRERIDGIQKE